MWLASKASHGYMHDNHAAWYRESVQRDACLPFLRALEAPYLAICTDVDEIPNMAALLPHLDAIARHPGPVRLDMAFFYYSFAWMKPERWRHGFVASGTVLAAESIDALRTRWSPAAPCIPDAGWHCSYFDAPHDLSRKLQSFSHREFDTDANRDLGHIVRCRATGKDLFGRPHEDCVPTPPGMALP